MTFPQINDRQKLTPLDHAELDKFYSRMNKGHHKCFLDNWNNDENFQLNLYKRIRSIAYVAWENGYDNIVLGPIGCGAFANDPRVIAEIFYNVFALEFRGIFTNVKMAYMTFCPRDDVGYAIFEQEFIAKANNPPSK